MIVKRLARAWNGRRPGELVVIDDQTDAGLVQESVVDPTVRVKALIRDWVDPAGVTHPAGTEIGLDSTTLAELEADGMLKPTVTGESD